MGGAEKLYYSISEVCELTGLKPHVLRYWESAFPMLNPSKNPSGNRVYLREEIALIQEISRLLYEERYTIDGARQKLAGPDGVPDQMELELEGAEASRQTLEDVRREIRDLLRMLDRDPMEVDESRGTG